jgi:hypothetical protein
LLTALFENSHSHYQHLIMKNHRKHPRHSCAETTFFSTRKYVIEGLIKNISPKGVFIECLLALPIGQNITVVIPRSGQKQGTECKGKVVWTNKDGFGVEFRQELRPQKQRYLRFI